MDDLLREVIDIFVAEVREQADRISQALLTMEQQPSTIPTEIEELYRQAHSLKDHRPLSGGGAVAARPSPRKRASASASPSQHAHCGDG